MNTVDFVVGQLLSFEMMNLAERPPHQRFRQYVAQRLQKERIVDNQLLVIAFLVVSLIANFTVMATPRE